MSAREETNADRIDANQRMLPPAKKVRSRLGYASLDELARLVGTNRSHIIQWKKGTEPSRQHRYRLAELSGGRYQPDDFRVRPEATTASLNAARINRLEEWMAELQQDFVNLVGEIQARQGQGVTAVEAFDRALRRLADRIERLETQPRRRAERS